MLESLDQELTRATTLISVWGGVLFLLGLGAWLHAVVNRQWLMATKGPPPEWKPSFVDFALLGIVLLMAIVVVGPLLGMEAMRLLPEVGEGEADWSFLVFSLSMQGSILGFLLLFYLWQRKMFATKGGGPSGGPVFAFKWALYGFILAIPAVSLVNLLTVFIFRQLGMEFTLQDTVEQIVGLENTLLFLLMPLPVVILAPLWEEIVFRGGLFRYLKNYVPLFVAVLVSAVCFSLVHGQPAQFGGIFVLGILLALVYQKSGSLLAAIFMHGIFNANTLLVLFILRFL